MQNLFIHYFLPLSCIQGFGPGAGPNSGGGYILLLVEELEAMFADSLKYREVTNH